MAEAGKRRSLNLEKELSCPICDDILYQPLTLLDCLHTYCGSCIKPWFAVQASQNAHRRTNPYTCPKCRATVRGTRPDSKINALLGMYLDVNPDKAKSSEEKADIAKTYEPGENVIPKPNMRSAPTSVEERRLVDEARALSLRDMGPRRTGAYERGHNHSSSRRDRHQDASPTGTPDADAHHRHIEHQSSLRSMLSSSDADSSEMVDEIVRQITEDGLLEGVNLRDIPPEQLEERLEELSERIAEAYRQRHGNQAQSSETRRTHQRREQDSSSRHASRSTGRQHSRSTSAADQLSSGSNRPPASRPHLLDAYPVSGTRRRTSSENRDEERSNRRPSSERPVVREQAARSATDLSDRPRSSGNRERRPSDSARRSTDPRPEPSTFRNEQRRTSGPSSRYRRSPASSPRTDDPPGLIPVSPPAELSGEDAARVPSITTDNAPSVVTSSPSTSPRARSTLYPEPSIACDSCGKQNIQYEIHEFCAICNEGRYCLCHRCYRSGKGCLHWFGFGKSAWPRFHQKAQSKLDLPHALTGRRFQRPRPDTVQSVQAAADSERRILTTEDPATRLQIGAFCAVCQAYADGCFWKCEDCNDGEWGFCNDCVSQGRCCTHGLLPLASVDSQQESTRPTSNRHSASVFAPITTPSMIQSVPSSSLSNSRGYRPLDFTVHCQICARAIAPSQGRYHCFACNDGDYDICTDCYRHLTDVGRIRPEDGEQGWRRCLQGHRMVVLAFDDTPVGARRIIMRDLVGGVFLQDEPEGANPQEFAWIEGGERKTKTVKRDLSPRPGSNAATAAPLQRYPPDGGVGLKLLARWAWLPAEGVTDELTFPRGAEIREALEISREWYMGAYAGAKGVFPSNYVVTLGVVTM